ncbi:MAG: hypothetical protein RIF41_17185 [Polyangiaceae bacterium]
MAAAVLTLGACGDDGGGGGDGGSGTGTSSGSPSGTGTGTTTGVGGTGAGGMAACDIPTTTAEVEAFLAGGSYTSFTAESAPHDSAGPHFGNVRVFVNDLLFDSLEAGGGNHPVCSAAIKELYGSGATVRGHSLSVKVSDGAGGDSWYWYELYDGSTFADSVGASLCTGCHGGGDDFVLSPFPLQ